MQKNTEIRVISLYYSCIKKLHTFNSVIIIISTSRFVRNITKDNDYLLASSMEGKNMTMILMYHTVLRGKNCIPEKLSVDYITLDYISG